MDFAQKPYIKFEQNTNKVKITKIVDIKGTFFYPIFMISFIDAFPYF